MLRKTLILTLLIALLTACAPQATPTIAPVATEIPITEAVMTEAPVATAAPAVLNFTDGLGRRNKTCWSRATRHLARAVKYGNTIRHRSRLTGGGTRSVVRLSC